MVKGRHQWSFILDRWKILNSYTGSAFYLQVAYQKGDLVCITRVSLREKGESKSNRDNTMTFYSVLEVIGRFFRFRFSHFNFSFSSTSYVNCF